MTAESTCFPVKSVADETRRLIRRVAISCTVTVDGSPSSLSWIVKATVFSYSFGCADACEWVGSIDLKLHNGSACSYAKGLVNPHSCPKKSLKYATVLSLLRTSCALAWPPTYSSPSIYEMMDGI
jgi:hypothetical protein